MSKILFFILPFLVISCIGRHKSDAESAIINPEVQLSQGKESDTLRIRIAESTIEWFATEMRGTRKRSGTILFKDGYVLKADGKLAGGEFVVDMESMDVTDVPLHERIARKNLLDHLMSNDFFNVAEFPTSTLIITSVEKSSSDQYKIFANLSIREITKNIGFLALQDENGFTTRFSFNRFEWNIAYDGSWANKKLIDEDVELAIKIVLER